jgi:ribosomal protein S18 acetylase RimI-like enzyme
VTDDQRGVPAATVRVGGEDDALEQRLDDELTAFNGRATGAGTPEDLTVRVDDAGELVGGLTAWLWGRCCVIETLWVREDMRHAGWGSRLMRAAEAEAVRRGCTDLIVSTYTFQAPGFYRKLGFRETGRTPGIPGGHQDVQLHKAVGP